MTISSLDVSGGGDIQEGTTPGMDFSATSNGTVTGYLIDWGDGNTEFHSGADGASHSYTTDNEESPTTWTATVTAYDEYQSTPSATPVYSSASQILTYHMVDAPLTADPPSGPIYATAGDWKTARIGAFEDPGGGEESDFDFSIDWGTSDATGTVFTTFTPYYTDMSATFNYSYFGTYTATLTITDDGGSTTELPFVVAVRNESFMARPIRHFSAAVVTDPSAAGGDPGDSGQASTDNDVISNVLVHGNTSDTPQHADDGSGRYGSILQVFSDNRIGGGDTDNPKSAFSRDDGDTAVNVRRYRDFPSGNSTSKARQPALHVTLIPIGPYHQTTDLSAFVDTLPRMIPTN